MLLSYMKLITEGTDERVERGDLLLGNKNQKEEKTGQRIKLCGLDKGAILDRHKQKKEPQPKPHTLHKN